MILRKTLTVKNDQLIVKLPPHFTSGKRVVVTVEDEKDMDREKKLELLKKSSEDRLFQLDIEEVNEDFDPIDHELL